MKGNFVEWNRKCLAGGGKMKCFPSGEASKAAQSYDITTPEQFDTVLYHNSATYTNVRSNTNENR